MSLFSVSLFAQRGLPALPRLLWWPLRALCFNGRQAMPMNSKFASFLSSPFSLHLYIPLLSPTHPGCM